VASFCLTSTSPNGAAAIPCLEVRHLLAVGVECVVVQKHGVAVDMAGIGGPEPRRNPYTIERTFSFTTAGVSLSRWRC